jgi:hypothetical protein
MSRVRVILNYVDIAIAIRDIKLAETFEDVVKTANRLEGILDDATKQEGVEFLKGNQDAHKN